MLIQDVTYTDPFTNEEVTETLHFNLSKAEVAEMVLTGENFGEKLRDVAQRADAKELIATLKDIIRKSYGMAVEVEGRKSFKKTPEISEAFLGSEAYSTFFWDMVRDLDKVIVFVNGIMPEELMDAAKADMPEAFRTLDKPKPQDYLPRRVKTVEMPKDVVDVPVDDVIVTHREELTPEEQAWLRERRNEA